MSKISNMIVNKTGRMGLLVKKHSPEILVGIGVVSAVSSTVLACKATLKIEDSDYSEEDASKDKAIIYVQTGVQFAKMYGPAISLGVLSITCFLGAHNVMKKRNIAVMAGYKAVEQAFTDYRGKVAEEFGEDKDREFKYGVKRETIEVEEEDAKGKKKKVKKTVDTVDPNTKSQYARFYDDGSTNWCKTPEYNLMFLKSQQNYCNDILKARGHLFLNEVYDMLGIPRSQAGAVVGWVLDGDNDNFVDFGMYEANDPGSVNFVNGYERSILLDFNVDGMIYDLI